MLSDWPWVTWWVGGVDPGVSDNRVDALTLFAPAGFIVFSVVHCMCEGAEADEVKGGRKHQRLESEMVELSRKVTAIWPLHLTASTWVVRGTAWECLGPRWAIHSFAVESKASVRVCLSVFKHQECTWVSGKKLKMIFMFISALLNFCYIFYNVHL